MDVSEAFIIANKQEDGTPDSPVGDQNGAVLMFLSLDEALPMKERISQQLDKRLSIFRIEIAITGEIVA